MKFLRKLKKKCGGGSLRGGSGIGCQGGCEQRIEVFGKFKNNYFFLGGGGPGGGGGGGGSGCGGIRVDVNEELKFL